MSEQRSAPAGGNAHFHDAGLATKAIHAGYRPDPYVEEDYKRMRDHKWYMSGRMITVHDIYSFDPAAKVELEEFTDVIGRNFRQPEQGLGFDNSPVAHMWRAMIRPAKYL